MERRRLLRAFALSGGLLTGCIRNPSPRQSRGGAATGSRQYEECDAPEHRYEQLPADLQTEVDAAFEDGAYETRSDLLYDQAVTDEAKLWKNGDVFTHETSTRDGLQRLSFDRQTSFEDPGKLRFEHATPDEVTVSVSIVDEAGETIYHNDSITLGPSRGKSIPVTDEFGVYEVTVELGDGRTAGGRWRIGHNAPYHRVRDATVSIELDDIEFSVLEIWGDPVSCPWYE